MNRLMPALFMLLIALPAAAQDGSRVLSAELLWQLDRLASPVVSPDGRQVVVQVTSYPADEDEPVTRLWLLDASGETQRPLTAGGYAASSPVFSPDGSRLAFTATKEEEGRPQIFVLPMDGPGEAVQLGEVPTGASALRWEGSHVYFLSNVWPDKSFDEMAAALEAEKEKKVSAITWTRMPYAYFDRWLDEERQTHLYRIPAAGGEIEALTPGTGLELSRSDAGTGDYDVAPDESLVAFVANSREGGVYPDPDVYLLEPGKTDARNLTEANTAPDTDPLFSPDGRRLAWLRREIEGFYADRARLMMHDLRGDATRELHGDWDRSAAGLAWAPDGAGLYGSIDDAGTQRIWYLPAGRGEPRRVTGRSDFDQVSVAANGTLVARMQTPLHPPRIVRVNPRNGASLRLDTFNDAQLADVELGRYESVTYAGADGAEIQMWVHYPPGFDSRREWPLLLLIHGGPHGAITEDFHFRWNAQVFASWGYVTAWPNFHGSTGFGQDFADAINPDWITKPYADVIAAADWLAAQPWIDETRMVAAGGSYGGYLSSIILGREHPFNALVIHAAVYDLYAQNSADFAVHDQRFGPYWQNPELYRTLSPHTYAANFETPSLVIHGQKDLRVPVGQGFELFRALQTKGIDSRLVYYPDENHWVLKRENSLHWYGEVRDWVERYAAPGPAAR